MAHNLHTKLFLTPMHVLKAEEENHDLPLLLKGFRSRITAAFVEFFCSGSNTTDTMLSSIFDFPVRLKGQKS